VTVRGPDQAAIIEPAPTTRPVKRAAPRRAPVSYRGDLESLPTDDGKVAMAMTGGVVLYQQDEDGVVTEHESLMSKT
jgi:hypothetical protein